MLFGMATPPELTSTENQGEKVSPWVGAPADSHVLKFRFFDRSLSEFGASSEIWVTFKGGGKSHKPPASYRYSFSSHDKAKQIWADLCGSAHPGEVIDAELKKPRVPFSGPFYD